MLCRMLVLEGPAALSAARVAQRLETLRRHNPGLRELSARFVHLVDPLAALGSERQRVLERLLAYGAPAPAALASPARELIVVPRLGTISPWSSKATDIAHICGLHEVRRIERGIRYQVAGEVENEAALAARPARPHDRVGAARDRAGGAAVRAGRAAPAQGAAALADRAGSPSTRANGELGLALAADEIDYLRGRFHRARARPHRRRADDVRAGQQRALPAQDLQRRLRHRRRAAAPLAVPDDPPHHREQPGRRALRLQRQRRGDRGPDRRPLLRRSRQRRSTRFEPSRCTS